MMVHAIPAIIPLAPLVAALLAAFSGRRIRPSTYRVMTGFHVAALAAAIMVLRELSGAGNPFIPLPLLASSWDFFSLGLSIDRLAAVMMVLITGIGTVIHLYSIRFMHQEGGVSRFHALLSISLSVLLCMVSSASLVTLFLFWQLLSWFLCLLAHHDEHPPTVQGAFRTFIILRAGDMAFLSGIVLAYHLYQTVDFQLIFQRAAADQSTFSLFWPASGIRIHGNTLVTLLIFIGAMSKSAQFPLHVWLPDSLYAPTPVHALLHAGIINAGGFLLNRLAPLYAQSPSTLHVVFAVGLLTALLGASMMLTQNDIKKTLGYSTIGQMGYMIMECGLGAFGLAVFHLIAHGLFKATIFLNCGNVIHSARQDPRLPKIGEGDRKADFSLLTWLTGFVTTLILPLVILLAIHGVLEIPSTNSRGAIIFLFFSWITSSQAILTLYRLRALGSWKAAGVMLLTLVLVISTYLLAVERFTLFLYPSPDEVTAFFHAAALPLPLFNTLILGAALFLILYWVSVYTKDHRHPVWMTGPFLTRIGLIRSTLYLFFMNRLYLDGLLLRMNRMLRRGAEKLDRSRLFLPALMFFGFGFLIPAALQRQLGPSEGIPLLILAALTLPLFPFHGLYAAAVTRQLGSSGALSLALIMLLPAVGLFLAAGVLPALSPPLLAGVRALALAGAFYGSVKGVVQTRVGSFLAYVSLSVYSILWWFLAENGRVTLPAAVFAGAAAFVSGGLFLAWTRVRVRYGDLELNRIGGLARPMPRLAVLLAFVVMAGAGIPPFGLFSGYLAMLLSLPTGPTLPISPGLVSIMLIWFGLSWSLFRFMQTLLSGPHRGDIPYVDLRPTEAAPLVLVVLILLAIGFLPYGCLLSKNVTAGGCASIGFSWTR